MANHNHGTSNGITSVSGGRRSNSDTPATDLALSFSQRSTRVCHVTGTPQFKRQAKLRWTFFVLGRWITFRCHGLRQTLGLTTPLADYLWYKSQTCTYQYVLSSYRIVLTASLRYSVRTVFAR